MVVFNGALGGATLDKWDPTPQGYYATHNECPDVGGTLSNPQECNYIRVHTDLVYNGFSDHQVQAVFIKSSTSYPQCDLKRQHCTTIPPFDPDAYQAERYLGNIVRYLKCCKLDLDGNSSGVPRYPNLQMVFVTSRTYGGYAVNPPEDSSDPTAGCLMPEPFAFEEGIAVQRLIVAQINQAGGVNNNPDEYAGPLTYDVAPWVDWGPYLWADGTTPSSGSGLNWCDSTTNRDPLCQAQGNPGDFRYGDLAEGYTQFWGDHTHPTAWAAQKVANQLVKFIKGGLNGLGGPQQNISNWVTPWIQR
ncbi:MAG: hypothetical protein LAN83_18065 [Acidobacteriia bacterium]|nr:hypothetical protein [Terriglobia bacterium]